MITKKTTFVLGAGASAPFGFPTGTQLYDTILNILQKGREEFDMLRSAGFDDILISSFTSELKNSGTSTIDEFLEHRKDFDTIGKMAISLALIPCENIDNLFVTNDNWYKIVFQAMNTSFENFHKNNVRFITFNYDRSLEAFLFNAIKNKYKVDDDKAAEALFSIPKLHVHGVLGGLPFQDKTVLEHFKLYANDFSQINTKNGVVNQQNEFYREYNSFISPSIIRNTSENIATIYDDDNPKEYQTALDILQQSDTIVFLGFGYHKINLERLGFSRLHSSGKFICGTSLGISENRKSNIQRFTNNKILAYNLKEMSISSYLQNELILT